jgi:phage-related protein
MSEVWIDDVDLADYGFVLGADPKHLNSPAFSDATATVIGGIGQQWSGEPVSVAARQIVIAGNIRLASSATYLAAVESIKALLANGAKRLRFSDHTDQEYRDARLVSFTTLPKAAILSNLASDVSMTFDLDDPLRYDVNPQGIVLSSTRASCPMGTAPAFPLIYAHGNGASLTNLVITVRDVTGTVIQTMTFTNTIGASDYRIIDCAKAQVTKYTAGTAADGLSEWTSGDFPALRPADGAYAMSGSPTVELSSTTGTPGGLITYARAWL